MLLAALLAVPTLLLALRCGASRRLSRLGADDRGLETLEYALLALVGVVVLAYAINNLGGSISGLLGRIGKEIDNLG